VGLYRLSVLFLVPLLLVIAGTIGYYVIERPTYSLFDSLYMTVITLTTVGYGEVHPLSPAGRAFTIVLLLGGVFTLFYTGTEIVRWAVSGELHHLFGRRYMERRLAALSNHVIICGYGRMGRIICKDFSRQGRPFVLIDRRAELAENFDLAGGLIVVGDATTDEVLKRAGVDRAGAFVSVVPSDADNLYITMSARLLNSGLFIVARAEGEEAEQKLLRAGADRVVAPFALGGSKVVQAVTRPTVLEFIELATRTEHLELQIEQTEVAAGSQLAGATLASSRLRPDLGLIIVAIKKRDGAMTYTPPPEARIEAGDTLIALGRRSQLEQLEALARKGDGAAK
jgi:voltage-gated potassium channel